MVAAILASIKGAVDAASGPRAVQKVGLRLGKSLGQSGYLWSAICEIVDTQFEDGNYDALAAGVAGVKIAGVVAKKGGKPGGGGKAPKGGKPPPKGKHKGKPPKGGAPPPPPPRRR